MTNESGQLKKMFDVQRLFTAAVLKQQGTNLDKISETERERFTKDIILHAHTELSEVLNQINWKMHFVKHQDEIVRGNVLEEVVDTWKYLLNILLAWGVSPEEFASSFHHKSTVVEFRWKQEQALRKLREDGRPVAALDLDGVLVDYPRCWLDWLCKRTEIRYPTLADAKAIISPVQYARYKLEYRENGEESTAPAVRGAVEAARELAEHYALVVISARPVRQVARLASDTIEWLDHHGVDVAAVYFDESEHKALRLARDLPNLSLVVEDTAGQAEDMARLGIPTYLVRTGVFGNTDHAPPKGVVLVQDLAEIVDMMQESLS